jgi:hypothetical protein
MDETNSINPSQMLRGVVCMPSQATEWAVDYVTNQMVFNL